MSELRNRGTTKEESEHEMSELEAVEAENLKLQKLVKAKEENKRLRKELEGDSTAGEGAAKMDAASVEQRFGAGELMNLVKAVRGRKGLSAELQKAVGELLELEETIRAEMQKSSLSKEDRCALQKKISYWEHCTQQLMANIFMQETHGKRRKNSGLRKIMLFVVFVIILSVVVAALVRMLFYHPKPPVTVRT
eukprot:TRINITY_DN927_c4_g1_i1.p1 TRINITY_DN927_c4_g1~~TRINITY_DN927_c4_g1_i1.p1  ORF type:complete len:193 (+),score=39.17 TRINITY_DN927_c4_g1_i1:78-656(+)